MGWAGHGDGLGWGRGWVVLGVEWGGARLTLRWGWVGLGMGDGLGWGWAGNGLGMGWTGARLVLGWGWGLGLGWAGNGW